LSSAKGLHENEERRDGTERERQGLKTGGLVAKAVVLDHARCKHMPATALPSAVSKQWSKQKDPPRPEEKRGLPFIIKM
jgi:hypothetical protein